MILALLGAVGIATAGAEGYEADDVLGTLATRESTDDVIVVSGDRDLLQLVRDEPAPLVRVFYVGRGLARQSCSGRPRSRRNTVSPSPTPATPTPTSPRCAVTPPTDCRASRASGRSLHPR